MTEGLGMNEFDAIMLQVELAEVLQRLQFVAVERSQPVVIQVQNEQTLQTAERLIMKRLYVRAVQQQRLQVLFADEGVVA